MRGLLLTGLISALVGAAQGQFFTNYAAEAGLVNPDLSHVLKDQNGFLWTASSEGLWRFDGATFKRFDTDRPLRSGAPRDLADALALAPDGRLWMVSFATGLRFFDPVTERFTSWEELVGDTSSTTFTLSPVISVLSNDSILALDRQKGLLLFLPQQGLVRELGMPKGAVRFEGRFMQRDQTVPTKIWIGANGGLWSYDLRSRELVKQKLPEGLIDNNGVIHVNDVIQRADGKMWVGTWGDGLFELDTRSGAATCYAFDSLPPFNGAKNIVFGLERRSAHELYVAAQNGLWIFDERSHRFRFIGHDPENAHSLLPGNVLDVLCEENGTLWCCTQSGLSCMAPDQNLFQRVKLGKELHRTGQVTAVQGIVELGDQWLVATDISGLLLADKLTGSIRRVFGPKRSAPSDTYTYYIEMFRCGEDSIELRTDDGAFLLDPKTWKMRRVLKEAFAAHGNINVDGWGLCCEGNGWAWTGTRRGCYRTNSSQGRLIAYEENSPSGQRIDSPGLVAGIARDRRGRTWFTIEGTGIGVVPPEGTPIQVFRSAENQWMMTPELWDLDIDAQDRIWIGTREYGMVITPANDPGGAGTRYLNNKDGLTSGVSSVMALDSGDVWAGGSSGLYRISARDLSIKRFGTEDGLYSSNFFSADMREHPSGLMTIESGRNEFIWFHPDSLEVPLPAPRVWIEGALVNGVPFTSDSTLNAAPHVTLPHDSNYVDIRFSAIALTQRHRIALEYRLLGNSERWVRTKASGTAIFTGLPPGAYSFEVRAAELADAPITRLAIMIVPAFWQTDAFKALIAVCVIGGAVAAVRWRLRVVRGQERLRSDFERRIGEVEMSALRAQMNPHFLFNSLNSINRYIVRHEPRIASEYLTKFSRLMRSVLNNSKEKLVPLRDELEALRLYIDLEALRFTNKFDLRSKVEVDKDPALIMVPPLLLQPYVENAIWHGLMQKKEGECLLTLNVYHHQGTLRCEVEDNGIGRAQAAQLRSRSAIQRPSYGTRITQERLDLLKRIYGMEVGVEYVDLMDAAQQPLGTRVILTIQQPPAWNPN